METPYQKVKHDLLCGACRAAKFMFWDNDRLDDRPSGLTRDAEVGLAYLVRCDYFQAHRAKPPGRSPNARGISPRNRGA